mmetsp:Transcript_15966/g.64435  ORF Transcript_15966/g.64435 Transcript_15966/m.64435 type:complete len:259 (+) Transcript_15966:421-1197(+)
MMTVVVYAGHYHNITVSVPFCRVCRSRSRGRRRCGLSPSSPRGGRTPPAHPHDLLDLDEANDEGPEQQHRRSEQPHVEAAFRREARRPRCEARPVAHQSPRDARRCAEGRADGDLRDGVVPIDDAPRQRGEPVRDETGRERRFGTDRERGWRAPPREPQGRRAEIRHGARVRRRHAARALPRRTREALLSRGPFLVDEPLQSLVRDGREHGAEHPEHGRHVALDEERRGHGRRDDVARRLADRAQTGVPPGSLVVVLR